MAKPVPDQVIVITVDGRRYEFNPARITGTIAGRVRAATGLSVARAGQLLLTDPDIDVFAAVCFAAKLQTDPAASYESVADAITYTSEVTVESVVADPDPET